MCVTKANAANLSRWLLPQQVDSILGETCFSRIRVKPSFASVDSARREAGEPREVQRREHKLFISPTRPADGAATENSKYCFSQNDLFRQRQCAAAITQVNRFAPLSFGADVFCQSRTGTHRNGRRSIDHRCQMSPAAALQCEPLKPNRLIGVRLEDVTIPSRLAAELDRSVEGDYFEAFNCR